MAVASGNVLQIVPELFQGFPSIPDVSQLLHATRAQHGASLSVRLSVTGFGGNLIHRTSTMKTARFVGTNRKQVEAQAAAWKSKNPGIREISYVLSEEGSPAGRFAPKAERKNSVVTVTIDYD